MSGLIGGTILEQPAQASYSAYTRREEDWKKREANGGELHASQVPASLSR